MKIITNHHPIGTATDRIRPRRILTLALAVALTAVWVSVPTAALAAEDPIGRASTALHLGAESPITPPEAEVTPEETPIPTVTEEEIPPAMMARRMDPSDPHALTHTSEELSADPPMELPTRTGYRPLYPYPAGAMAVTLYKDGRQVLQGHAADIGGIVYVPVQRFADLFGSFRTVYVEATEEVVITGTNLSIAVRVGDPYITVNERIFYTGAKVISLGGWIFVPLTAMCKALGAEVTIRRGYYDAFITSGNPAGVARASEVYDSTDLYWLSRIISAEAKGESLEGQIAVGNVVLNRVRSSQFPDTVKEVIFDTKHGTQFAPAANGTVYQAPTASSIRAAKICLEGYSLSSKALYFFNPRLSPTNWISQNRPFIMTIGNHKFYG